MFDVGPSISTYAPKGGGWGSSLLYISVAYYMQKGGGWVQIACKIAYVLNGRPHSHIDDLRCTTYLDHLIIFWIQLMGTFKTQINIYCAHLTTIVLLNGTKISI